MYKIILIDDDAVIIKKFCNIFPWGDYNLDSPIIFNDSLAAIEYIKNNDVNVVMTDIKMPKPDGLDISKFCYETYPNIKVILLSGYRDFEYAQAGMKYNAIGYLTKPIDYSSVCDMMQKLKEIFENEVKNSLFIEPEVNLHCQEIFADLLCGFISDIDELSKQLISLGITDDPLSTKCALVSFHINDFSDYIDTKWKYPKERLYTAIIQLVPYEFPNTYCSLIRYAYSHIDWIVIDKNKNNDFEKSVNDFINEFLYNIDFILNISADVRYIDSYNSFYELLKDKSDKSIDKALGNNKIIDKALKYMEAHYKADITQKEVADYLSMNSAYFSRYFKQKTNKKFIDMLTSIRMDKTKDLLINTDAKTSAICDIVGYKSTSHFYNLFKQYTGLTPAKYRYSYKKSR